MIYEKLQKTTVEDKFLKAEIYYSKGGYHAKRGYYLRVTPVKVKKGNGYTSEESSLFGNESGDVMFIHEVGRQSDKQFQIACSIAEDKANNLVEKLTAKVSAQSGWILKE